MSEEIYTLTEAAIMQNVLKDFGVTVSTRMASAIFDALVEELGKFGYLEKKND